MKNYNYKEVGGEGSRRVAVLLQKLAVLPENESLLAGLEKLLRNSETEPTRNCNRGMVIEQDRLLRLKEVLEIIPISKSTFWSWVAEGKAPQPIRLGRCTCWKYAEIKDFTAKKGL